MPAPVRIAAALIDDGNGRLLLVRKRDTVAFMQAGGKIEDGETAFEALARELTEELDFTPGEGETRFVATYRCEAANEPGHLLEAHLFHIRLDGRAFVAGAELAEAVWVPLETAARLPLAPLTRDYALPLARTLRS